MNVTMPVASPSHTSENVSTIWQVSHCHQYDGFLPPEPKYAMKNQLDYQACVEYLEVAVSNQSRETAPESGEDDYIFEFESMIIDGMPQTIIRGLFAPSE